MTGKMLTLLKTESQFAKTTEFSFQFIPFAEPVGNASANTYEIEMWVWSSENRRGPHRNMGKSVETVLADYVS